MSTVVESFLFECVVFDHVDGFFDQSRYFALLYLLHLALVDVFSQGELLLGQLLLCLEVF
jgi:hypothetical protein